MHAVTIRRMIVFGVCALGVGSLYLVPSIARSPEQIGVPKASDEPTSRAAGAQPDTSPQSASPSGDHNSLTGSRRDRLSTASTTQSAEAPIEGPDGDEGRSTPKSADETNDIKDADETNDIKDSVPPAPVAEIEPSAVTVDLLSLTWPAATDDVGVIGYRIWLNGFDVATTAETKVKLHWFNEDSGNHVVQIRAIDAAGNQSRSSPTLVVVRPSPEPAPTPTPSESPTPTDEPTNSSRPAAQASPGPRPTGHRSESER